MKRFSIVQTGYDINEVNRFIDIVVNRLEKISNENTLLTRENERLLLLIHLFFTPQVYVEFAYFSKKVHNTVSTPKPRVLTGVYNKEEIYNEN